MTLLQCILMRLAGGDVETPLGIPDGNVACNTLRLDCFAASGAQ
jgi:hypothetical protein